MPCGILFRQTNALGYKTFMFNISYAIMTFTLTNVIYMSYKCTDIKAEYNLKFTYRYIHK